MSMSNLVVQPSAAHLMTDSGYFDREGRIHFMGHKTMRFPGQFLALGTAGYITTHHIAPHIRSDWQTCSQGELIADIIEATKLAYAETGKDPIAQRTVGMIAGYSHQFNKPFGGYFFSSPFDATGSQMPWCAYDSGIITAPFVTPYCELEPMLSDDFDFGTDALPLIQKQREFRGFDSAVECGVAGPIHLTTVNKDGVFRKTIHEFEDRVGSFAGEDRLKGSLEPSPIHCTAE